MAEVREKTVVVTARDMTEELIDGCEGLRSAPDHFGALALIALSGTNGRVEGVEIPYRLAVQTFTIWRISQEDPSPGPLEHMRSLPLKELLAYVDAAVRNFRAILEETGRVGLA